MTIAANAKATIAYPKEDDNICVSRGRGHGANLK